MRYPGTRLWWQNSGEIPARSWDSLVVAFLNSSKIILLSQPGNHLASSMSTTQNLPEGDRCKNLMKPPRAYARGILHFFGAIRRSTLLRSPSFGGSPLRSHPWTYVHGLLRRRISLSCRGKKKQTVSSGSRVARLRQLSLLD